MQSQQHQQHQQHQVQQTRRQQNISLPVPPNEYLSARQRALELHNEVSDAKKEVVHELIITINNLQKKFMDKYSDKLYELEDLEESIQNIQKRGLKDLSRQLNTLYYNVNDYNKEEVKMHMKTIQEEYQNLYHPKDEYHNKKKAEALQFQKLYQLTNNKYDSDRVVQLIDDDDADADADENLKEEEKKETFY